MSWVWDEGPDDPIDRYVLLKLADNADQDGKCFPSLPEICDRTRLSESSVRRAIQSLEKAGLLSVERGRGAGKRSQYQLHKKVSDRNLSERNLSQRNLSVRQKKGVTETEKGVTETNPPHPLIGVTVNNRHEPSIDLPVGVSESLWLDFEEMRRKLKKPMTPKARELIFRRLLLLQQEGNDPVAVLEQSIEKGWQGVFPLKSSSAPKGMNNAQSDRISPAFQRQHNSDESIRKAAALLEGIDDLDEPGPLQLRGPGIDTGNGGDVAGRLVCAG